MKLPANWRHASKSHIVQTVVITLVVVLGVTLLFTSHAATPVTSIEAESNTPTSPATIVSDGNASGGKAVQFGTESSGGTSTCTGAANTPGGADPWGGCFPGANNTGVPAGTNLVSVDSGTVNPPNSALPADNTGWAYSTGAGMIKVSGANAVIDGINDTSGVFIPGGTTSITIKNSQVGYINGEGGTLLVENSIVNGGNQAVFPSIQAADVTVMNSNLFGGKDEVNCQGNNCVVENSWLHDNYDPPGDTAHQQGFFSDGGANITIQHSSIFCTGQCTADITLATESNTLDNTIKNNLIVASPDSSFCVYPGPNAPTLTSTVNNVVWENNIFQKGANGICARYGPVTGWFPTDSGSGNIWSNNLWDDGTPLNE